MPGCRLTLRSDRRDRGASAVEFALVVPILLALMLGIVDYGMWFADSLSSRQGVREGARLGAVETFNGGGCGSGSSLAQLACTTDDRIGAVSGPTWVRVISTKASGAAGWEQGGMLTVCSVVRADGLTGLTPMPKNHLIFSSVAMRIEQDQPTVSGPYTFTRGGSLPSGMSWPGTCS